MFFSCLPTDRRRDASRTRAKSRRRVSRFCELRFFRREKHHVETNKHAEELPRDQSETARERKRVTMPLIYAFVARGPTVLAEHTSHSGNFATVAAEVRPVHLSDSLESDSARRVARRLASRRSPRARRAPRGALALDAARLEGVDASVSRTTATSARVPRRPPAEDGGGAKRPFASVFFFHV